MDPRARIIRRGLAAQMNLKFCVLSMGFLQENTAASNNVTNYTISAAVFKMDFVFATKNSWSESFNETSSLLERQLAKDKICDQDDQLECCVADEWNGLTTEEYDTKQKYCKRLGCKRCAKKYDPPSRRFLLEVYDDTSKTTWMETQSYGTSTPTMSPTYYPSYIPTHFPTYYSSDSSNETFNAALQLHTILDPITSGGVLGDSTSSLQDLAECRANNYNSARYKSPILKCKQYDEYSCDTNDYAKTKGGEDDDDTEYEYPPNCLRHFPPQHIFRQHMILMYQHRQTRSALQHGFQHLNLLPIIWMEPITLLVPLIVVCLKGGYLSLNPVKKTMTRAVVPISTMVKCLAGR